MKYIYHKCMGRQKTFLFHDFLFSHILVFECWWEILRNSNKFTQKTDARAGRLVNDDCFDDGFRLPFFAQFNVKSDERRKILANNSIQISHCLSTSIQAHHCLSCVALDSCLTFCSNYFRFKSIYWNLWIKFYGNVLLISSIHRFAWMNG